MKVPGFELVRALRFLGRQIQCLGQRIDRRFHLDSAHENVKENTKFLLGH